MLVSGTLDPDAIGTYRRAADKNGREAWRRNDGAYYIWWSSDAGVWYLNSSETEPESEEEPYWSKAASPETPTGLYNPGNAYADGDATVTSSSE
jgi:hypothetical protein